MRWDVDICCSPGCVQDGGVVHTAKVGSDSVRGIYQIRAQGSSHNHCSHSNRHPRSDGETWPEDGSGDLL